MLPSEALVSGDTEIRITGWNIEPQTIRGAFSGRTDSAPDGRPCRFIPGSPASQAPSRFGTSIIIGIVIIQPIAPMGIYGAINNEARGHVVTTILIAMVAMLFTAISYGKMARAYPSAGSAYTYVGREIHPALGYVTGWAMVMDYILNPLICTVICSKLTQQYPAGSALLGVRHFLRRPFHGAESARDTDLGANQRSARRGNGDCGGHLLRVRDSLALGHCTNTAPGFSRSPFTIRRHSTFTGCSAALLVAVLTYIGFDGISTFSEEAENPRRNILLATVLVCVITGVLSALEVYAAQLVWGDQTVSQGHGRIGISRSWPGRSADSFSFIL